LPNARLNGTDLYYELEGDGAPVVFIHGENHGIELFEGQVARLVSDYRCLTYYRRGHGLSAAAPYGYSVWNQTLDLVALLDELGIDRIAVVAVAMSTPIAVTFATAYPERVSALVLASWYELDGYPQLEARRPAQSTFPALQMQMHEVRQRDGQAALEAFMEQFASSEFPILPDDPGQRALLIRMFTNHPPDRYVHAAEFYTSLPYLIPQLRSVRCPVLGICGEDDPSPDRPELLDGMPNFRQAWIACTRRFPSVERPDVFTDLLIDFLREDGG
jgi:pimeloyl-ACP methyl ester carboxylesterase